MLKMSLNNEDLIKQIEALKSKLQETEVKLQEVENKPKKKISQAQ